MDFEERVKNMTYSEFVSLTKERNRPSGGIRSVQRVAVNAFIDASTEFLEIGCNTGFTSVNMSLLTGCHSTGIDINENSLDEARKYADRLDVNNKTVFKQADATNIPFKDNSFDTVWVSNVTSFIEDKHQALQEYLRVLKYGGRIIFIPIYYQDSPPEEIVNKVSQCIGQEIDVWNKEYWLNLIRDVSEEHQSAVEKIYDKEFKYLDRSSVIERYAEKILDKEHLQEKTDHKQKIIKDRLKEFMAIFNENLQYANFSILIFQKRSEKDEIELFKSVPA